MPVNCPETRLQCDHACSGVCARRKEEIETLRKEIRWTQINNHPHGCGDMSDGPLCEQNLDGTCPRASCRYFGLTASEE